MRVKPIFFEEKNGVGIISLNRPQVLNSLNFEMIRMLRNQLLIWKEDSSIQFIILKSDFEKAFCAGGDLKEIYESTRHRDTSFLQTFFQEEYSLNELIFNYPKPYLSLINGICMGGGMGISVHGSHRIVTDNSVFAMPEVFIGFFPDVGASYFLNRCPGKIGLLLALSGYRMNGADALYVGLATHYVPQENFSLVFQALTETDISAHPREGIQAILDIFSAPVPIHSEVEKYRSLIDSLFSEEDLGMLIASLRLSKNFWMQGVRQKIEEASPLSLAITHHLLKTFQEASFEDCMDAELKLASNFFQTTEVLEGIRSVVIDKDRKAQWIYKAVTDVPEEVIERYFN